MLPFSASPLVGLWHFKLNHCGASGPNLNIALGCSASAWLGEAGMTLGYSAGYRIHSIPLDRMGLGWGRESLNTKRLQMSFPTEGHQVTENPVKCAGEVDPQMARGVCQWLRSLLRPPCQAQHALSSLTAPAPQESSSGLEQGTGPGPNEDKGNCYSRGLGVTGVLRLFFFSVFQPV